MHENVIAFAAQDRIVALTAVNLAAVAAHRDQIVEIVADDINRLLDARSINALHLRIFRPVKGFLRIRRCQRRRRPIGGEIYSVRLENVLERLILRAVIDLHRARRLIQRQRIIAQVDVHLAEVGVEEAVLRKPVGIADQIYLVVVAVEVVNGVAAAAHAVNECVLPFVAVKFVVPRAAVERAAARADADHVVLAVADDVERVAVGSGVDVLHQRIFIGVEIVLRIIGCDRHRPPIRREIHSARIVFKDLVVLAVMHVKRSRRVRKRDRVAVRLQQDRAGERRQEIRAAQRRHALDKNVIAVAVIAINRVVARGVNDHIRAVAQPNFVVARAQADVAAARRHRDHIVIRVADDVERTVERRRLDAHQAGVIRRVELRLGIIGGETDRLTVRREYHPRQIDVDNLAVLVLHIELSRRIDERERVGAQHQIRPIVGGRREIVGSDRRAADRNDVAALAVVVVDRVAPAAERRVEYHIVAVGKINFVGARAAVDLAAARAHADVVILIVADDVQGVGVIARVDRYDRPAEHRHTRDVELGVGVLVRHLDRRAVVVRRQALRYRHIRVVNPFALFVLHCSAPPAVACRDQFLRRILYRIAQRIDTAVEIDRPQ